MTERPRIPADSHPFHEIPGGMIEKGVIFAGNAAQEILEDTGLKLPKGELINLSKLGLEDAETQETLNDALYPSHFGSDEYIPIFLGENKLDRQEIKDLRGKLTGVRKQGEIITLQVVR
jgi:ADP-sugar diphosphatase